MVLVFLSNTVESAAGFGATILALTFGAQFFPIEDLIPILVPLNFLLSLVIVLKHRSEINGAVLLRKILPVTALGLPLGMLIFHKVSGNGLKLSFGIIVTLLSLFELGRLFFYSRSEVKPLPKPVGLFFLFFGDRKSVV